MSENIMNQNAKVTKLLVMSDLHLSFGKLDLVHEGRRLDDGVDVVVLAGDIDEGTVGLDWARENFPDKPIVYVAGNHEFYYGHWDNTLQELRDVAKSREIHFLENDSVTIQGIRFLGATMWTDFELLKPHIKEKAMRRANTGLNDYSLIRTDTDLAKAGVRLSGAGPATMAGGTVDTRTIFPQDAVERHMKSRDWLMGELSKEDQPTTVVVTHHAPTGRSVPAEHKQHLLSTAYAANLEELMHLKVKPALWIHGHIHTNVNLMVGETQVVCNARGYYRSRNGTGDNEGFRPGYVVEVEG